MVALTDAASGVPQPSTTAATNGNGDTRPSGAGGTTSSLATQKSYHLDYLDFSPSHPDSSSSQRFIAALRSAMVGHGFFYLFNTPLSSEPRRTEMYTLVERFFNLPLSVRQSILIDNSRHFRGYTGFADERTQKKPDLRDQIDFGPDVAPLLDEMTDEEKKGRGERNWKNLLGPNQFVEEAELPGFREAVLEWYERAQEINDTLTFAVEMALGVPKGRLSRYLAGEDERQRYRFSRLKLVRYPAGAEVDGVKRDEQSKQGVGAHADSGWLTLLSTSPADGLEVQDLHGNWLAVPYLPSSIVVNFGQQFENLSRGLVQAATHRVISSSSSASRYSVPWFSFPALDARLQPLEDEELGEEVKRRYAEVRGEVVEKVNDVEKGDLFAEFGEEFGDVAWRGLVRSHPGVVGRWYGHLLEG